MDKSTQREKAERLRELHHGPAILVLPNAWDVASAVLFAQAGFGAIATTSAGIAATLGYPDGERISRDEMLAVVGRIAAAVDLPVTADMEAGYGGTVAAAVATAEGVIAAGAVGLNLEDATDAGPEPLADVAAQAEKIQAIRAVAAERGVPLVVNARTDVYLLEVGEPDARFAEAVRRLSAYRQAGADCLFVPDVRDAETIGRLVHAVDGPLNVLAGAGTPPIGELARLGVARVSVGSGPMRATLALVRRIAAELRDQGTYTAFTENALAYAEVNRLLER
jgi:2-methylisocitrate lyase-like PEP mutase family enzyme